MVIMKAIHYTLLFGLSLYIFSCKPKYIEPELSQGEINTERFAMIGDGHSGGYMNDALYHDGQITSLGYLLGQQLERLGGEPFTTRLINPNSVGASFMGQARLILDFKADCNDVVSLSPVRAANIGDLSLITVSTFSGEALYRDFGIPGLRAQQLFAANFADFNAYYARIASSDQVTIMQDVLATAPTFFAMYLGMEECMSFARSGGAVDNMPTEDDFATAYNSAIEQLIDQGAKGVLATIPDVTTMPFFRTIPYNGLEINEEQATTLNLFFNPFGISFQAGVNPFLIMTSDTDFRPIASDELLLLSIPLDSVKCHQYGVLTPFRNEFVLTSDEQAYLKSRMDAYNNVIRLAATTYNLALVETNDFYQKLFSGFTFNGVDFSATFVSGGAFSLDGIHLNGRGNAFLANEFIRSINRHYAANIPALNANAYDGVLFP
jgi:hypothetical protein